MVIFVIEKPGRSADEDEFGEELRAANGSQDTDHGGDGVADVSATVNAESFKNIKQIVDESIESVVPSGIEVIGVDAAGTNEVV